MQAKVINAFRDKYHPEAVYGVGDVFEGDEARVEELSKAGFVEPVAEKPKRQRAKKSE